MTQTLEIKAPTKQIKPEPQIIWEKLPEDFVFPDEPAENMAQPLLAAALTEALALAGLITAEMLIASNMAICVKVNEKIVVKAPDWFYVPRVFPEADSVIRHSYTPYTEGDLPTVVMEFLSEIETGEYSIRPTYPYGKIWYYERILRVPIYVIFDPSDGMLEIRRLNSSGNYEIQTLDQQGRYFIPEMNLFLGVWHGKRWQNTIYWLRWWDSEGKMLLWSSERISLERQRAEKAQAERQRAEEEHQKAEAKRQQAEAERQRADAAKLEVARSRSLLEQAGR